MDSPISQSQKLQESQARTRFLQVAAMKPDQSPQQVMALNQLERSQRAETKLRQKAVQHEASQVNPPREAL